MVPTSESNEIVTRPSSSNRDGRGHDKQESEVSIFNKQVTALKEESSDESTIISSQTSTLTRNQGKKI